MPETKDENRMLFDQILKGLNHGNFWQSRYILTPKQGLSNETVGGIWDMKVQSKTNKSIIRFENGYGRDPHINVDLTRYPSEKNLHLPTGESVVKAAEILNNTLHHVGSALFFASIALDAYRLGRSLKVDYQKQRNAADDLKALNEILREKREMIKEMDGDFTEQIILVQKDIELAKDKVPCETIKTGSVIIFSWLGGAGGAVGGGWFGGFVGSSVGDLLGAHGRTLGAFAGTIVGSYAGGIYGGSRGTVAGETIGGFVLKKIYDKRYRTRIFVNEVKV